MALNLSDLMKKAKAKGIGSSPIQLNRPWQQESVLFIENKTTPTEEQQENIASTTRSRPENNGVSSGEQQESGNQNAAATDQPGNTLENIKKSSREQSTRIKIGPKITREQQGDRLNDSQVSPAPFPKQLIEGNDTQIYITENIRETTGEHPEDTKENTKKTTRKQRENQAENFQDTTREHREVKTENQRENTIDKNVPLSLASLVGLQRKLFDYVLEACISRDELNTGSISTQKMAEFIGCSYDSAKVTLKRVIKKGLIIRRKGKGCRGGFIDLEVPKNIKLCALDLQKFTVSQQEQGNNLENKPGNNSLYSSSNINKTTTSLPEDWQKINCAPLGDIAFTEKHLADIYETKLVTAEVVQESIYHFAYGLENNPSKYKTYSDPLNVFIGCLRKGKPWFESNYVSFQEKALKELIERRKAEKDRLKSLEDELLTVEFEEWKENLNPEEKRQYLPTKIFGPEDAHLKAYFSSQIWPAIRSKLLPQGQNNDQ